MEFVCIRRKAPPQEPLNFHGKLDKWDKWAKPVTLQWEPPKHKGGSPITSYIIEYCNVSNRVWKGAACVPSRERQWVCGYPYRNLDRGCGEYSFRICAENIYGRSDMVELKTSIKIPGDAPGPVRLLNVTEIGYTHVSLSWLPPSKDNGSPATTYYCVCKYPHFASVLQIHNTNDTHYLMSDLKEGTEYCFQVSAANTWDKGKLNQIIVSTKQSTVRAHSHERSRDKKALERRESKSLEREKKYEENFKAFRSYIERCVTVKDLIAFFESYTIDQQQHLRHTHRTNPAEAVREALDYIQDMIGKPDRFQCLIRALKDADYPKVAGIIEGKLIPENDNSRQKIKSAYQHIYRMMSISDVMAYLHTNRVLNTLDCEEIRIVEHNHGRAEAAAELLFMLPRRDRNWYGKFIEALIACQQTELAALIDKDLVERILHKTVSMKLDLDWEVRSTGSVEMLHSDTETTASDTTEHAVHTKAAQTDIDNTASVQTTNMDSKSLQATDHIDVTSMVNSTALHTLISVHFVKLLDVLIRNNSFEESDKLESEQRLGNMITDWNKRLDALMKE